jgi:hypothetical protein
MTGRQSFALPGETFWFSHATSLSDKSAQAWDQRQVSTLQYLILNGGISNTDYNAHWQKHQGIYL